MSYSFLSEKQREELRLRRSRFAKEDNVKYMEKLSDIVANRLFPGKSDVSKGDLYAYAHSMSRLALDTYLKERKAFLQNLFKIIDDERIPLTDERIEEIAKAEGHLFTQEMSGIRERHDESLTERNLEPGHTEDLFACLNDDYAIGEILEELRLSALELQRKQSFERRKEIRKYAYIAIAYVMGILSNIFVGWL